MNNPELRQVLNSLQDLEKVSLLVLFGNSLNKHEERLTSLIFEDERNLTLLPIGGNHISHKLMTFDEFQDEHFNQDEWSIDCGENSFDCVSGNSRFVFFPIVIVKIV